MSIKAKYVLYTILDFALSYGGTAGVIVYNYITPENSLGFKLTFTGVVLVVALLLTAKTLFEKKYRAKYDTLLQQLAEAPNQEDKNLISKSIDNLKTKEYIYQRLMILLPFAIVYVVTWLGQSALADLNGTIGLILLTLGGGSVFNIIKRPYGEKVNLEKITKKKE